MSNLDIAPSLRLVTPDFVGKSVAVLGVTGSGKTNTAAVLVEELLAQGLPMTIVDIEGEYYGLKEQFDLLIAGRSEHAELAIGPENAAQLAGVSVQRGISVILDLSDYTQEETYTFLVGYFERLWEVAGKTKQPYQIVLEEAHEWIPQGVNTPLKQMLTRIALRGRKRGLGIILMSQRSAKVEKDILTQTSLLFLHRVIHPIDLKVYKDLIPLPPAQVEEMVGGLQPGQAIVLSNHVAQVAHIRLRHTFHAGVTPEFGVVAQPELRRIDADMLKELQALMVKASKDSGNSETKLQKRIKELEALLVAKDAEIAKLREENALLSKLSVAVQSPESLEIQHATVHSMSGVTNTAKVIEVEPISNHHTPVQQAVAAPVNEQKFTALKQRYAQIVPLHRRLLALLTEQQKDMDIQQIAAWLNVSESSVRNAIPHALVKMGLLKHMKDWRNKTIYRSLVREYLGKEFPGVDVERLAHRLFSEVR